MQVSRSVNNAIVDLAEALECLSQAMKIMAGELDELSERVSHIEDYLEGIEIEEDEVEVIQHDQSLLPCGFEGESEELSVWYSEGGPCYPQGEE